MLGGSFAFISSVLSESVSLPRREVALHREMSGGNGDVLAKRLTGGAVEPAKRDPILVENGSATSSRECS
jgi:hypothetical protein